MICGLMIQHEAFCSFGENLKIFSETSHTRREIWSFPIYVHEVIYEVWLWGVKNLSVKLESGFPLCYPLGKGILAKWDFIDWVSLICQRHTDGTLIVQKFPLYTLKPD